MKIDHITCLPSNPKNTTWHVLVSKQAMLFSPMELKRFRAFHTSGTTKGPITYTSAIV